MSRSEGATETRIAPDWLADRGVAAVLEALTAEGAEARFVGGCVRNALIGPDAPQGDIDIAVDRPPEETRRLLEQAGLTCVPTGFEHGTVTALAPAAVPGAKPTPLEVTSLRRDVATDGRRAVVAYSEDWAEDARRRDFTMNALYADREGRVYDPLGAGLDDLDARRLRFIGAAEDRIREDYLRILRFFRFYAWYGTTGELLARDVAAVERLAPGLDGLARERVGAETKKLLAAPAPGVALIAMTETGVAKRIMPGAAASAMVGRRCAALEAAEQRARAAPRWTRRLAAMIGDGLGAELDVPALTEALKLSKAEGRRLQALAGAARLSPREGAYRFGREAAEDAALLAAAAEGALVDPEVWTQVEEAAEAVFPLTAQDLIQAGLKPGPTLGEALRRAEENWLGHNFALDKGALIAKALDEAEG